ncbi:MAG: hypothetical protein ABWY26_10730 [Microbacterium sp.]
MASALAQITAVIVFDGDVPAPTDGVVHVAVLDVSRADAASIPVGRVDAAVPPTSAAAASRELEVALPGLTLQPDRDYIVRAHWEPRGDQDVRPGDQLTTSSVPVTFGTEPIRVIVPLQRIA